MNANLLSFTGIAVDHFALTFFFVLPAELHPSTMIASKVVELASNSNRIRGN